MTTIPAIADDTTVYKVNFIFGNSDAAAQPLTPPILDAGLQYLEQVLADLAGGANAIRQDGTYRAFNGSLVKEESTWLWGYTLNAPPLDYLLRTAATAARLLRQREVLLSVEKVAGICYFVAPSVPSLPAQIEHELADLLGSQAI